MTPEARFEKNEPSVVSETIDGEVVIINLDQGTYYSLQHIGAVVWGLIEQARDAQGIVEAVSHRYAGETETIRTGIETFLDELLDEQLIRENPAPASAGAGQDDEASGADRPAFQQPVLGKHTDMQDLLLLDPIHEVDDTGWPQMR